MSPPPFHFAVSDSDVKTKNVNNDSNGQSEGDTSENHCIFALVISISILPGPLCVELMQFPQ